MLFSFMLCVLAVLTIFSAVWLRFGVIITAPQSTPAQNDCEVESYFRPCSSRWAAEWWWCVLSSHFAHLWISVGEMLSVFPSKAQWSLHSVKGHRKRRDSGLIGRLATRNYRCTIYVRASLNLRSFRHDVLQTERPRMFLKDWKGQNCVGSWIQVHSIPCLFKTSEWSRFVSFKAPMLCAQKKNKVNQ